MHINGFGEFQQLRRTASRDDVRAAHANKAYATQNEAAAEKPEGDAVSISPMARNLARLHQMPEGNADRVAELKAKLENGELDTPEALERGTHNMLAALFNDDL